MPTAAEVTLVVAYVEELQANRRVGVPETTNYPALQRLFNEVGKRLQVRCIIHPRNTGAGIPDGGFFTNRQFKAAEPTPDADRLLRQTPERGVIEVKSVDADVLTIAQSEQVAKYARRYGQVLVTTGYDFQLVALGADGQIRLLERFRLAASAADFWRAAAQPRNWPPSTPHNLSSISSG